LVLSGAMEEGGYCFRVRDQGPGIPDFALPRIFERFYSLPRPDKGKSSGLGLSFAMEVARQHGGHLALANQPDGGVLATLWLPGN
ncbi:TPA: ATP-binding protein, partial [Klebsiella pneumoniae]